MNTAALIVALAAALFCVGRVGTVAFGVISALRQRRGTKSLHELYSPCFDTEISVAVCGVQSVDEIRRRLTMNYHAYEVIVVGDFSGAIDTDETLQTYRMVRMSLLDSEMQRCGQITVYRSRQRRYRRLILIDRPEGGREEDYRNCAAAVASFDHMVFLDAETFLYPDALQTLCAAAEQYPDRRIVGFALPPEPDNAVAAISWALQYTLAAAEPERQPCVELIKREEFIARQTQRHGRKAVVGAIASLRPTTTEAIRNSGLTVVTAAVIWLVSTGTAFVLGNSEAFRLLILSAVTVYAGSTASAALSLAAVRKSGQGRQGGSAMKITPKLLFLYPFGRMRHTIIGHEFRFNEKSRYFSDSK